jgi:mono/diheme cytochrome c family protein
MTRLIVCSAAVAAGLLFCLLRPAAPQGKQIKKETVAPTNPTSGEQMYKEYCAACHGKGGKGDGPAASELKVPPPDLTDLTKRNGGKFPADHIASVLRFGTKAPAHGTADMPVWGPLFQSLNRQSSTEATQRITSLTNYIKSLQAE